MSMYRLEKLVDGEWYAQGKYSDVERLVDAAFELGRTRAFEFVRVVEEVEKNET